MGETTPKYSPPWKSGQPRVFIGKGGTREASRGHESNSTRGPTEGQGNVIFVAFSQPFWGRARRASGCKLLACPSAGF